MVQEIEIYVFSNPQDAYNQQYKLEQLYQDISCQIDVIETKSFFADANATKDGSCKVINVDCGAIVMVKKNA